ncbi:unnamed protein product [Mortierella alpina]
MTPRGIQVWFQNRRAKSKLTSSTPQDHIGAVETRNHDEASRVDESLLSLAQTASPPHNKWHEGKDDASPQKQEHASTAALSSSSLVATAPLHSFPRRQTAAAHEATSSFSNGNHTSAHRVFHLTWDPSQNWQNTPNPLHLSQTSPPIKSSTGHGEEPAPRSSPGVQDKSVERLNILQASGSKDSFQPSSVKAPSDKQEVSQQNQDSAATHYHPATEAAMDTRNHSSPSTLSLMRRMSMPATINSDKGFESSAWLGPYSPPSPLDLQQSVAHTHIHQPHSQTPFAIPQHPASLPTTGRPIYPFVEHEGKSSVLGRAHSRAYPLLRRVSIHETGNISTQANYKAKFTHVSDVLGNQRSDIGSLAAAAAARRLRRSSVSKPAHLSSSELSTMAEISSGTTATLRSASSAEECSKQNQELNVSASLDPNASLVLQDKARTTMASNIGYNNAGVWCHDYFSQYQRASDSLVPQMLGRLDVSTGSSLSEAGLARTMAEHEERTPHQLQHTAIADGAAPSAGAVDSIQANKTGRRRSSLKTGRTRPQLGTRVQFDVQPMTPLTQQYIETQNKGEVSSTNQEKPHTFNGLPQKQEPTWNSWTPSVHQEGTQGTPPVAAPDLEVACSDLVQSFFPYTAMAELNQCLPNEAQSQALQDSQQLRRNSCPPEFIECFSRGLQIIPETLTLEENQQAFMDGLQSNFQQEAQQEAEHQYSFHMQSLQMQQQQQQQHLQLQQPQLQQEQPQQLVAWSDTHEQLHLLTQGSAAFQMPRGLSPSQDTLGLNAALLDDISAFRAPASQGRGRGRGDMDSKSIRRMNLSDLGPRQQPTDAHNLPQLQTPRLLAQLQHQIGHPSWSRTMSLNIEPLAGRSRPALPDTFQNTIVRRYSEPGRGFELTADAPAPCHSGAALSDTAASSTTALSVEQHESAQHQVWHGDVALTKQIPLPEQSLGYSFSKALHPLEAAMTSLGPNSAPNPMALSTPTTSLKGTSPSTGPQMTFFPSSISIASASSSLSPEDSPSSSPLTDKHYSQEFSSSHTASPASSVNTSIFDIASPLRGSSVPTCGSQSVALAVGHSLEAPLLMRAHSLDSLMLQVTPRDPQVMVINSSESSPLRRHSQGQALMNNSTSDATVQLHQSNTPTPGRELSQQADHHSYFSLNFQPYPSPSSYGAQAPLDIHPLEQKYHYQQLHTYNQLPSAMAQQPGTLPSPPYASPTFFSFHYDASGPPVRATAVPHTQEAVQSPESKNTVASARALGHFEAMQQSLPHTKHQRRHLTQGPRRVEPDLQSAQEQISRPEQQHQQHQQPSPAAEWSMSLSPLSTAPDFRDPRAFEEYKHQQFLLEHKRLQQQELTEQQQPEQQQQLQRQPRQ